MSDPVEAACLRAREAARAPGAVLFGPVSSVAASPRRDVVVGDAQAPLTTFFEILDRHDLLTADGTLAEDAHLVSIGDHFDFGGVDVADTAAVDGLELLAWLAAHDTSRTSIILGNHDLGRVGELASFDDRGFAIARERAAKLYASGARAAANVFLADYPMLPSTELAARDFASFHTRQRTLVTTLLEQDRFRIAVARGPSRLICHAGVTVDDLERVDIRSHDATDIAEALQVILRNAVERWGGGPLHIPGLHAPGNADDGEGGGIFYHRPADPVGADRTLFEGAHRRRFDPARLPRGITQVIGHIRDNKCRSLLARFCDPAEPGRDGPLRSLLIGAPGRPTTYGFGVRNAGSDEAALVFVDGGMGYGGAPTYELLDLTTMRPLSRIGDPTLRFTARAANYDRARPRYPSVAIDYIRAIGIRSKDDTIVDLGAGTGLLAERFIELGDQVILVEPNADMAAFARDRFGHRARIIEAPAEATTLADNTINLIIAGQAFHWFDPARTRTELKRIAAPDAHLALVWNQRRLRGTPFLEGYEAFLNKWGVDYAEVAAKYESEADMTTVFGGPPPDPLHFENPQHLDRDGLVARIRSCSYIPGPDHPRHTSMREAIDDLFDANAEDDQVTLIYDTTVYVSALLPTPRSR